MRIVNPVAKLGEDKACEYLKKLGFEIIERNFRKGYGELNKLKYICDISGNGK